MGESYEIDSAEPLRSGRVHPVFEFDYDGGGSHKGATGSIIVNGKKVGTGRIEKTMGHYTSLAAETADIGHDSYVSSQQISIEKPTVSFLGVHGQTGFTM